MSNVIDNRVVDMKFNNGQFETAVGKTLGTLEKLKAALNFDKSTSAIKDLEKTINGIGFDQFGSALSVVKDRLSAWGIVGMTIIQNVANGVINTSKNLLTAIPRMVSQGGLTRALNIEQAQFQLKGLGVEWNTIKEDILYGVKDTAYGLDSAAKAASQLVASGVKVGDEMKGSLRAISGVAAMTNASYEEISPIFTTVAGQGKLMTMQLRQLESRGLNAAANMGKVLGKSEAEIRELVTKGKIDFKTFSKAMDDAFGEHAKKANETYTGSLSNMKAAFSRIGADVQAVKLRKFRDIFNTLTPLIDKVHEQSSKIIEYINKMITLLSNRLIKFTKKLDFEKPIKIIEKAIISVYSLLKRIHISKLLKPFSLVLDLVSKLGKSIKNGFLKVFEDGGPNVLSFINVIKSLYSVLLKLAASIRSIFIESKFIKNLEIFATGIFVVFKNLLVIIKAIGRALSPLADITKRIFSKTLTVLSNVIGKIGDILIGFDGFGGKAVLLLNDFAKDVESKFNIIGKVFSNFKTIVATNFNTVSEWFIKLKESLGPLGKPLEILRNVLNAIQQPLVNFISLIGEFIGNLAKSFVGSSSGNPILDFFTLLNTILISLTATKLFSTLKMLEISFEGFRGIIWSLKKPFFEMGQVLKVYQATLKVGMLLDLAKAVAILAGSMLLISLIDPNKLNSSLGTMTTLLTELMVAITGFYYLTSNGIGGKDGLFKDISQVSKVITYSYMLKTLASSLLILSVSCALLSTLDWDSLKRGLVGVGVLLTELYAFMAVTKEIKPTSSTNLLVIASALTILVIPLKIIASMDPDKLAQGLIGIGSSLAIMCLALASLPDKKVKTSSASLIGIATSLLILSGVLLILGNMDVYKLMQGLLGIAGALSVMIAGLIVMDTLQNGVIKSSAALLILSNAMVAMALAIKILGGMKMEQVGVALTALGGALLILGIAAFTMSGLIAPLLAIGGAIALLGVGVLGIGSGLMLLATGLSVLAVAGPAGIAVLTLLITSLLQLIPILAKSLGEAIITFVDALFTALIKTMAKLVDQSWKAIIAWIDGMTAAYEENAPRLKESIKRFFEVVIKDVVKIFIKLGKIVKEKISEIKDKMISWIKDKASNMKASMEKNIDALIKGIIEKKDEVIKWFKTLMLSAKKAVTDKVSDFKQAGIDIINGLINGIKSVPGKIVKAVTGIANSALSTFKKILGIQSPSKETMKIGKHFVDGFCIGVNNQGKNIKPVIGKLIGKYVVNGTLVELKSGSKNIKNAINNFILNTIKDVKYGKNVLNELKDIYSKTFYKMGQDLNNSTVQLDIYKNAKDTLDAVVQQLYKTSDAYKESSAYIEAYSNQVEKENKKLIKAEEELEKVKKQNTKASKKRQKDLEENIKSYKANIKDLNKAIKDELKSMDKAAKAAYYEMRNNLKVMVAETVDIFKAPIQNYIDTFKKFEEVEEITINEILLNMQSQIRGVDEWRKNLTLLSERAIEKGLLEKLREMGPSAANYIKAFLNMTEEELSNANTIFRAEMILTSETLIDNMKKQVESVKEWANSMEALSKKGLNKDIYQQLMNYGPGNEYTEAFKNMTDEQIKEVNAIYKDAQKMPSEIADKILSSFGLAIKNVNKNLSVDSAKIAKTTEEAISEALNLVIEPLANKSEDVGETLGTSITTGIKSKVPDVKQASKLVGNKGVSEIKKYFNTNEGTTISISLCDGMINGLRSGRGAIIDAARETARAAYEAALAELEINSPSRKFEEIGKYSDLGFAKGLKGYAYAVTNSAEDLAKSAYTSLHNSIVKMTEAISQELDGNRPVIKPVLDLSNINQNAKSIGSMFSSVSVSGSSGLNGEIQNGSNISFVQNNYSPKSLSRVDIYRQTKNQLTALKGLVNE